MFVHAELRRRHAGLDHAVDGNVPALDGQAAQRALQLVERQTGIEQRAEDHVPGRAREAVKVEDLHRFDSSLKLKYVLLPRMMWSITTMPITSPAAISRRVIKRSAGSAADRQTDDCETPPRWWPTPAPRPETRPADGKRSTRPSRSTGSGCESRAASDPATPPQSAQPRSPRSAATSSSRDRPCLNICGRSSSLPNNVRRPSSTAASRRAAREAPTPGHAIELVEIEPDQSGHPAGQRDHVLRHHQARRVGGCRYRARAPPARYRPTPSRPRAPASRAAGPRLAPLPSGQTLHGS